MSSVLDVGARGPAGAGIEGNLAVQLLKAASSGAINNFVIDVIYFKSDSAYRERSSPERSSPEREGNGGDLGGGC